MVIKFGEATLLNFGTPKKHPTTKPWKKTTVRLSSLYLLNKRPKPVGYSSNYFHHRSFGVKCTMQVRGILESHYLGQILVSNIRKHILFHAFDASNMHLMQVAWCSMQHPFQCFLLTFYIIFKMSEWNWKNAHRSTAKCSSKVSGATQTPNVTKSAPSPKSHHQPNQLPTKPIPSRRWLKEPLLGRPHVIQFQDSEAEPRFFQLIFFSEPLLWCFFWLNSWRWFCGFLWRWYVCLRIAKLYMVVPQPSLLGVSFLGGKAAPQGFGRLV